MDKLGLVGTFSIQHYRNGKIINSFDLKNTITNAGKNKLLDVMFHADSQVTAWYLGLINNSGFTAIAATDTHSSHAGWTELTDYDESGRQEFVEAAAATQSITNSANQAVFTINATVAIKGIFLASLNTKGSTAAGTLWSAAAFSSVVNAESGDTLTITYTVSVS